MALLRVWTSLKKKRFWWSLVGDCGRDTGGGVGEDVITPPAASSPSRCVAAPSLSLSSSSS